MLGYSLTSAPLVVKDKVLVGVTGGEFGARGFLDAYDAATGKRLWRWYAVPGPGEFGNDTWLGDSWKRGGSPMWLTGSYDPELNLVYWTVGNPGPQIDRSVRGELDNLFSDSVVAIDPDTGQRKWHYQFTPNDGHDWDSCQDVILVDRDVARPEAEAAAARRSQRASSTCSIARTESSCRARRSSTSNWMTGFDANGRPISRAGIEFEPRGQLLRVSRRSAARTNFQAPSYSPLTGWMYLAVHREAASDTSARRQTFEAGKQYIGRRDAARRSSARSPASPAPSAGIKALDPETGKTMWDFKIFQGSLTNGVLATAGNVVFAAMRDGNLVALDAGDRQASVALPDRRAT